MCTLLISEVVYSKKKKVSESFRQSCIGSVHAVVRLL